MRGQGQDHEGHAGVHEQRDDGGDEHHAHRSEDVADNEAGHVHGDVHRGHGGDHKHHSPEQFRDRLLIVLLLNIPILAYSHDIQEWFGFTPPAFPFSEYVTFLFGTAIFLYGGTVFIKGAASELRNRLPGMMTLISLAIIVAYSYSVSVTLGLPGHAIYWELSTLIAVMLLGHWVEMRSISSARGALEELAKLLPDTADLVIDEVVRTVPLNDVKSGDVVLVRPGGRVPIDGEVIDGESYVDESMLTGESVPVSKRKGSEVIGGTVNKEGSLRIRVGRTEEDTTLAGIMRLVREAQESSSRNQALADRAAFFLTIIAIVAALVTAISWTLYGQSGVFVIERTVTVLVMACPHALGLAIPLVIAISVTLSAKNGLLVKDRKALEDAKDIDCVVFDKTGTLTIGQQRAVPIEGGAIDADRMLAIAAAAEADSEHMVSKAIVAAAEEKGLTIPRSEGFQNLPGRGVKAMVDGQEVHVGGPNLLKELGIVVEEGNESDGRSLVHVIVDGSLVGSIAIEDKTRDESREAVDTLKAMGVTVVMISGDSEAVCRRVADDLGIDKYFSQVLPEDKSSHIKRLSEDGYRVAMVGDGVNDAPALVAADLGIAIGAGTHVAVESAGIVLLRNDPRDVVRIIRLSKATYRKMIQNLVWATGYNAVAIPLAAGVLAGAGFLMPMAAGALLMSASTVIVALNAQLLRSFRIDL